MHKFFFRIISEGWGCNQDWGSNGANMVIYKHMPSSREILNPMFILPIQAVCWTLAKVVPVVVEQSVQPPLATLPLDIHPDGHAIHLCWFEAMLASVFDCIPAGHTLKNEKNIYCNTVTIYYRITEKKIPLTYSELGRKWRFEDFLDGIP